MTQNEMILLDLRTYSGVTAQDAYEMYGIMRLAGRIHELRKRGHNIVTETVQKGRVRYARYRLVKP